MELQKIIDHCKEYRIKTGCEGCPLLTKHEELCLFQEYPFPNDWGKHSGFQVGFSRIEKSKEEGE